MIPLFNPTHNHFGLSETDFKQMKIDLQKGDSSVFNRLFEAQLVEFHKLTYSYLPPDKRSEARIVEDIALDCAIKWHDKVKETFNYEQFTKTYRNTMVYNHCQDALKKKSHIMYYDDFLTRFGHRIEENTEQALEEVLEKVKNGWKRLCERCKILLERVDQNGERVDALAIELGISRTHLSTTLGDCRRKLAELSRLPLPSKIKGKKKYW
jgi:DNA-directed RNA polymerase specialized sigma24 family protein